MPQEGQWFTEICKEGGSAFSLNLKNKLHQDILKAIHRSMRTAGFSTTRTLQFFQCIYPSGWWSCTLAGKERNLVELRVDDIKNRNFQTQYYNSDIHDAAGVLPEFIRVSLSND